MGTRGGLFMQNISLYNTGNIHLFPRQENANFLFLPEANNKERIQLDKGKCRIFDPFYQLVYLFVILKYMNVPKWNLRTWLMYQFEKDYYQCFHLVCVQDYICKI